MGLAEKLQITVPYSEKEDDGNQWADANTARVNTGNTPPEDGEKFNRLPSTSVGVNEEVSEFAHGFGGDTDVSGDGLDPASLKAGYKRRDMKGTDDQYSGEHVDLFYGEAVDEKGNVGFAERNNYLDRL
jgi:hypothetical protein